MVSRTLTYRQEAEAIEQFGMDLIRLSNEFDKLCASMSPGAIDRINAVPGQDQITTTAAIFLGVGRELSALCDEAEEAEDRRRANPLEPDFRRIA
jgi:hypothetical protein